MADTSIPRVPLGAPTVNRKWWLDIDTSATATPSWIGVFGVQECKLANSATTQDDGDFDSGGYGSTAVTGLAWGGTVKVVRKVTAADPTTYDPGQEALRLAADEFEGETGVVHVRWYEMTPNGPRVEAYEGYAVVQWEEDGGNQTALDTVTVTLSGRGKRTAITHPASLV
jgi:hypothetical protein